MIRLITQQRVIDLSFTNTESNEIGLINDSVIEVAQLRWIKPILGDDLWDLLESEYPTFSSVNQDLADRLEKPLAFFVKYELIPDMSINTTSAGLQVITTEYSSPATDKQRGQIQDQALHHAKALLLEATRWIELDENLSNYPDYSSSGNAVNDTKIKGGIVF